MSKRFRVKKIRDKNNHLKYKVSKKRLKQKQKT